MIVQSSCSILPLPNISDALFLTNYQALLNVPTLGIYILFQSFVELFPLIVSRADLFRNRKVNTKKRQNRHLPELAFLILGTYFTAPYLILLVFGVCYDLLMSVLLFIYSPL